MYWLIPVDYNDATYPHPKKVFTSYGGGQFRNQYEGGTILHFKNVDLYRAILGEKFQMKWTKIDKVMTIVSFGTIGTKGLTAFGFFPSFPTVVMALYQCLTSGVKRLSSVQTTWKVNFSLLQLLR